MSRIELLEQMGDYPRPFSRFDGAEEEDDEEEDGIPKIRIGICAMSKKTNSQPMQEILGRMSLFDCVDIFVFPDDTILNVPVEEWPICDCLISFYSKGFPLEKAIEYAKLRKPFSLNDLEMQFALMDRKCEVLNRGFSGYTSAYGKLILPRILQCDNTPKLSVIAAVVLLGTNDSLIEELDSRGTTIEQYEANMINILSQFLNEGLPASHIVLLTPPAISEDMHEQFCKANAGVMSLSDERVKSFAGRCADLGRKLGVNVVDLYTLFHEQRNWKSFLSDGIHLSKEGSRFVADNLIPLLDTKLGHLPEIFPDWKDIDHKHPEKTFCSQDTR